MNYKKKLKQRIYLAFTYLLVGLLLYLSGFVGMAEKSTAYSFGGVFVIVGIVRIIKYIRIMKNESLMNKMRIAENDERNHLILIRAQSFAFNIYVLCAGTGVMIMYLMNMQREAQIIAYSICALVIIYLICYTVVKKMY